MVNADQLAQVTESLSQAKEVLIVLSADPSLDQLAAATSLNLGLVSLGKSAKLICQKLSPSDERIYGLDQVSTEIGHQNLLVAFDYLEEQVDKISYHISEDNKKFYLTIKPKKGIAPLDSKKVEFSYSGAEADVIVTLGVTSLESLDELYFGYEELYKNSKVINIGFLPAEFGLFKLDLSGTSSFSEWTASVFKSLGISYQINLANNLLLGLESATYGLSSPVATADTFQLVAEFLRSGAIRRWKNEALLPTEKVNDVNSLPKKNGKKPNNKETTVTIAKG